jgi:hypothetical protein
LPSCDCITRTPPQLRSRLLDGAFSLTITSLVRPVVEMQCVLPKERSDQRMTMACLRGGGA